MAAVTRHGSLVPAYIESLVPYQPGKTIQEVQQEYGLRRVVKLGSNENPLGPSPNALMAMAGHLAELHRYPDAACPEIRLALAQRFGVKIDNCIVGSGSEGIMSYIVRAFMQDDDEVLTSEGTFIGFTVLAKSRGVRLRQVPLKEYRFDLDAMAAAITPHTKIIFLCNPNNPTGTIFTRLEFEAFLARVPERVVVILDEAYVEYAKDLPDFPDSMHYRSDNVITLRTFSKAYGLAGLRLGYGFAHDYFIRNLLKVKMPFEPGTLAQVAGLGALEDETFVERTLALNREGLKYLYREFDRLGLAHVPSCANFIMVVRPSQAEAERLCDQLLRRGMIVRPLAAFGLPACIRITVGLPEENRLLVAALDEILAAASAAS